MTGIEFSCGCAAVAVLWEVNLQRGFPSEGRSVAVIWSLISCRFNYLLAFFFFLQKSFQNNSLPHPGLAEVIANEGI